MEQHPDARAFARQYELAVVTAAVLIRAMAYLLTRLFMVLLFA